MEELQTARPDEVLKVKKTKKKLVVKSHFLLQTKKDNVGGAPTASVKAQNSSKRNMKSEPSTSYQPSDRSSPDSLQDTSRSGDEYRVLRRKYLLLEEESFNLGKEMSQIDREVKAFEDEKLALLDQLVVMEGLIDVSEIRAYKGL